MYNINNIDNIAEYSRKKLSNNNLIIQTHYLNAT